MAKPNVFAIDLTPHMLAVFLAEQPDSTRAGLYEGGTGTIVVYADQPDTMVEQTLVHELLHAFGDIFRVPDLCRDDEQAVGRLEHPFYLFLKQNTDFFDRFWAHVRPETKPRKKKK